MAESILKIIKISKSFGGVKALTGINVEVKPGSIHSIIGPNGSGKTTLINVITGFYKPDSGDLYYNGENIVGHSPHVIARKGIGRTFQNLRLFDSMTVEENIKTALSKNLRERLTTAIFALPSVRAQEKMASEQAFSAMEKFGIVNFAKRNVASLPYGTRRMVEIARALCLDPRILILEEPVAGMNSSESMKLMEDLRSIVSTGHITIILIEHDMKIVMQFSDEVTVINYGSVIAQGLPIEIQNNYTVIEAYLGHRRTVKPNVEKAQ